MRRQRVAPTWAICTPRKALGCGPHSFPDRSNMDRAEPDLKPDASVDVAAKDFGDLADKLGA